MAEVTATLKKLIDNEIKDVLPKTRSDVVIHGNTTVSVALDGKVDTSTLGAASGVATLDANGKLNSSQIPSGIGGVEWQTLS